jgi:hypothetical protein
MHVSLPAGLLELALLLELGAHGERVDGLVLRVEGDRGAEDRSMRLAIEVVRVQGDRF